MTIIYDDTDLQTSGGCCCGPAVPVETGWYDDSATAFTEPTDSWTSTADDADRVDSGADSWVTDVPVAPVAPAADPAPQALQSVIPAGQPGGPVVADAASFYPSVAVIGGDPLASTPAMDLTTSYVGGGNPAALPASFEIGPPSSVSPLVEAYGVAAENGDLMSQLLLQRTMDAMNNAVAPWVSPWL